MSEEQQKSVDAPQAAAVNTSMDSDDELGSEFCILDERGDLNSEVDPAERSEHAYVDASSLTVSEYVGSESHSMECGEVERASVHSIPYWQTLSLSMADKSVEQIVEKLLAEYKHNQQGLEQVLVAIHELKNQKTADVGDELTKLRSSVTETNSSTTEQQIKIANLEKLLLQHVNLSASLMENFDQKLEKIASLSEKIDGLSLGSTQLLVSSSQNTAPSVGSMSVLSRQNSIGSNLTEMADEDAEEKDAEQDEKASEDLLKALSELNELQQDHSEALQQLTEQADLNVQLRDALDVKAQEIYSLKEALRKAEQELETQKTIVGLLQDEAVELEEPSPVVSDYENQIKSLESELLRLHERGEVNFV